MIPPPDPIDPEPTVAGDVEASAPVPFRFALAQDEQANEDMRQALELYLQRTRRDFSAEELFARLYAAAQIKEQSGFPEQEVLDAYLSAHTALPSRAEALHGAARFCRRRRRFVEGLSLGRRGLGLAPAADALLVEDWIYTYGLPDEVAVNAWFAGEYRISLDCCLKALAAPTLPEGERARILGNARRALGQLALDKNLGAPGAIGPTLQHTLLPPRPLRARLVRTPRILLAILARGQEAALPFHLRCIEDLDYPKSAIVLNVHEGAGGDATAAILRTWLDRVGPLYADVVTETQGGIVHSTGHLRNVALRRTVEHYCDFHFATEIGCFPRGGTLRQLVALDLPIATPLLRDIDAANLTTNIRADVDPDGGGRRCDQEDWIVNRWVRGILEVPLIQDCCLVRADMLADLTFQDDSHRPDFVVFSDSARAAKIPQYVDNRQIYGYRTHEEGDPRHLPGGIALAEALLEYDFRLPKSGPAVPPAESRASMPAAPPHRPKTPAAPLRRPKTPAAPLRRPKTLVFCTAFAWDPDQWRRRYRRWVRGIRGSMLQYDQMLIVDDGSASLPNWSDAVVRRDEDTDTSGAELVLHSFPDRLGRNGTYDFPGWYRSYAYGARYAVAHGFEKVVHVESDLFLIGERPQSYINDCQQGWATFWCPLHMVPEAAIEVIAGDALRRFANIERTHPHESLIGRAFEDQLPFDVIETGFNGNRYGEFLSFVPGNAEFAAQVKDTEPDEYYWWMAPTPPEDAAPMPDAPMPEAPMPEAPMPEAPMPEVPGAISPVDPKKPRAAKPVRP